MRTTHTSDVTSPTEDVSPVRLRVTVYDALAAKRGLRKVVDQAKRHGVSRATMFRVRAGDQPALNTAMRMAADLGTTVEALFGPASATTSAD